MDGTGMREVQLLIIGAGPAGLSAAIRAAGLGVETLIIDENQRPGGQLLKQIHKFFGSEQHNAGIRGYRIEEKLLEEASRLRVETLLGYPVLGIFPGNEVIYNSAAGVKRIRAEKILIAAGANENNLYFEGSTLPGVMTAGAAQTMVNLHRVLPGQRVVMIGSGNVGLIVSYQLEQAGAQVAAVVEAGEKIGGYDVHAGKLRRLGIPFYLSHTVKRALGEEGVEEVELIALDHFRPIPGTEKRLPADVVCMAVGLTPMTELAAMAGCGLTEIPTLGGTVPLHDENMRTTNPDIYIAGDISGIEEASTAMEEGRLAGLSIAESLGCISKEKAAEEKDKIRESLKSLRSGQFGQSRQEAKQEIIRRFWETGENTQNFEKKGMKACIECTQQIPCNPCEKICPRGAIHVGENITSCPTLDKEKCNGCGLCIAACPGQAIFGVDEAFSVDTALVRFPYEFLPMPKKGQKVRCLDREGHYVTDGTVHQAASSAGFDHTALVTVEIPRQYAGTVRFMDRGG